MTQEEAVMRKTEVTREHREAAVRAMYPDASSVSPIWAWIARGDTEPHEKPGPVSRVAQAIADAEARGEARNAENEQ